MSRLAALFLGPVGLSRRRKKKLIAERSELNPVTQREAYARLTKEIEFEDELVVSYTAFFKEQRAADLKKSWSVSFKRILQLLGFAVVIIVTIFLKMEFFG
jgi:chromatin segregation and condensation protein Rec8/ScpA/Scc1 (kleisin family)